MDWLQNWEALLSLAAMFFSTLIWLIHRYKVYWSSKEVKSVLGEWYQINLTNRKGISQVVCYQWSFTVHWLSSSLIAKGVSLIDGNIMYEGKLSVKAEFIYLNGVGKHACEKISIITKPDYPIEENETMVGVGIGLTYDKTPFATKVIFQRKRPDITTLNKYENQLLMHLY